MATCPSCALPADRPFTEVSRHTTSEGIVVYSTCVCGEALVHLIPHRFEPLRVAYRPTA
ncbi:hypothetical protein [Amycolatopsis sp. CA-230715]|uniref:hypothetical protein n=1 Tax=Amycolatopsis sp. CA-230715 TaxID=2745196 RepID=UPI001C030CF6|nr:hypothetical protein [Amycolatopsis sp. CA-230715]QWF80329.1 hypothetical protein HUW46_03749 [Amycolatopsis sp. CA-230715]